MSVPWGRASTCVLKLKEEEEEEMPPNMSVHFALAAGMAGMHRTTETGCVNAVPRALFANMAVIQRLVATATSVSAVQRAKH